MTKKEFTERLAEKTDVSKKDALFLTDAFIELLTEVMLAGDSVGFAGFGKFEAKKKDTRIGFNPRTKQKMELPSCYVPYFKAGKALKDSVNEKLTEKAP